MDRPLHGRYCYTLRFPPHAHPPVRALWSLTAYDEHGYAVPNAIDRYSLGSQDELEAGRDGSIELAIQPGPPRHVPAANWLPCPPGAFNLSLRLYRPEPEALDHTWEPPPVRRHEEFQVVRARRRPAADTERSTAVSSGPASF
jgi:hypothetical protein